jgi:hypothetical protein
LEIAGFLSVGLRRGKCILPAVDAASRKEKYTAAATFLLVFLFHVLIGELNHVFHFINMKMLST